VKIPSLLYLYGLAGTDAPAPPADLRGVEGAPVRSVPLGSVVAVVSAVPADEYGEAEVEARLTDLAWVGERGVAHERVLGWFADRGPVIPLAPFSLHRDEARLRERLAPLEAGFRDTLERLRGRREYGVRVWRTDAASAHLGALSPAIRSLEEEIAAASPGRRFLLQKKHQAVCRDELRGVGAAVARDVFDALAAAAERAVALSIAVPDSGPAPRVLVLHAAFLVEESAFAGFRDAVSRRASELGVLGFECEFTGPWPPYHFADR
jgi:hypothetical protein